MICPRCGKPIPDASKFCNNCGLSFQQQNAVAPYTPPAQQPTYQQPPLYQQPIPPQPVLIQQTIVTDGSSIGAFILGLLVPLIITMFFWISWHTYQPLKTRSLLFGALTHFLVFNLPGIIFWISVIASK